MSLFRRLSIRSSILFPSVGVFLLISLLLGIMIYRFTNERIEAGIKEKAQEIIDSFYNNIRQIEQKNLLVTSLAAKIDGLERLYGMADEKAARDQLRVLISPMIENIQKNLGIKSVALHFHKAPARSFLRPWRKPGEKDGGDDLSAFRNTLIRLYENKKPILGIEVGKGGLVIRGIAPIMDRAGRHIGSVELHSLLNDAFLQLKSKRQVGLGLFLLSRFNEIIDEKGRGGQAAQKIGGFALIKKQNTDVAWVSEALLQESIQGSQFHRKGKNYFALFPLYDYNKEVIGVTSFSFDISPEIQELSDFLIFLGGIILGAMFLYSIIIIYISNLISAPVKRAVPMVQLISEGDMRIEMEVHSGNEIGTMMEALRTMVIQLRQTLIVIQNSSQTILNGAREVSTSSQDLSQGANEQAATVEETSASLQEISSKINKNSQAASETEKIALATSATMDKAGSAMKKTIESMREISGKISMVEEIAYQTNILALNAAIEAARAGNAGKGFAVVADEVRKLAQRSQVTSEEINRIAQQSMKVADESGRFVDELIPQIKQTLALVQSIANSSQEQASSVEHIFQAVSQQDSVTQKSAATAEELAATSEQLSAQVEELSKAIAFFRV